MENISVNALVDSYQTHLPREISLNVAKGVISKFDDKETILNEYKIAINALISSKQLRVCLLYTSPSPRDATLSRMPSSA